MGQLDIQMAQQIARENDRDLTQTAEFNRLAAQRGTAPRIGSRHGLRRWAERLHVLPAGHFPTAHPARLA